ncbi:DUF1642 domain-containing protein [Schleiferilactobacillus shenzhenensis]|nr:DUF1642 domain-containing protein [Schleiferilactobacillus shenzhenensis]
MTKYIKTASIEAEQFDGSEAMAKKYLLDIPTVSAKDKVASGHTVYGISTLEGYLYVYKGDWIATGSDGEHWPIANYIFRRTYKPLPVIPPAVAGIIKWYKQHYSLTILLSDAFDLRFPENISNWITRHDEIIARAWLDGYETEDEDDEK